MLDTIKKKIEDFIIRKSFGILRKRFSENAFMKYAENEMTVGKTSDRTYDTPNLKFLNGFPDLIAAVLHFNNYVYDEYSPADMGVERISEMIHDCMTRKPVFPLTFDKDEFENNPDESNIKRNKRLRSVGLSDTGKFIYSDAVDFIYSYDVKPSDPNRKKSKLEFKENKCKYGPLNLAYLDTYSNCGIWAIAGDGQIYFLTPNDIRIMDPKTFDPDVRFSVHTYAVSCPDLHMLVFCMLEDLSSVSEKYDIIVKSCQESVDMLNKEIEEHCAENSALQKEVERRVEWTIKTLSKKQPKPVMK